MKILLVLPLVLLAFALGCNKTTTIVAPEVVGDLKGTVYLSDAHGGDVQDKSGVYVLAEGTSISAVSDTGGNWILHDLPSRTYVLSFSKAGYGTMKNTSFSFLAGGTVPYDLSGNHSMWLSQPVAYSIVIDSVRPPDGKNVYDQNGKLVSGKPGSIKGHFINQSMQDSARLEVLLFIGNSPNIDMGDPSTYLIHLDILESYTGRVTRVGNQLMFEYANWLDNGPVRWLKSGDVVYAKAYSPSFDTWYYDVVSGKRIYSNPIPTSSLSGIVP
ncbi:MAG: carboxypeptidase-like regulatory domain-containing protein [Bacteroidota bacterium]|nr:carboxypeptidase-like regulatory domain-containing protein [Bacteroidota bacterium]MDP4237178.1 carboxypeptidase-like regulatory domain-containing protein [Bacteroidota bacterium]